MKGITEKIFSLNIRFKDKNGERFPEWRDEKLGEISTITTGSSNREDSVLDGEFVFFDRSQDIRTSNRYLFDKEAIIIPGEGQEFTPKYYIGKFDLHQRTYAIFDFIGKTGKYLYYYISHNNKYLLSLAVGSTVKSLRLPMFQSMPIKLPCIEEQILITNILSSIAKKIETEKQLLEQYENQKKYLLLQMFI
jgi:type I restriction enzyme S subunit